MGRGRGLGRVSGASHPPMAWPPAPFARLFVLICGKSPAMRVMLPPTSACWNRTHTFPGFCTSVHSHNGSWVPMLSSGLTVVQVSTALCLPESSSQATSQPRQLREALASLRASYSASAALPPSKTLSHTATAWFSGSHLLFWIFSSSYCILFLCFWNQLFPLYLIWIAVWRKVLRTHCPDLSPRFKGKTNPSST